MKVPYKLISFAISTKNSLSKWNWHGTNQCVFFLCYHDVAVKHMFFECSFARVAWSIIQTVHCRLSTHAYTSHTFCVIGSDRSIRNFSCLQFSGRNWCVIICLPTCCFLRLDIHVVTTPTNLMKGVVMIRDVCHSLTSTHTVLNWGSLIK
jgi:hypothetical protein